MDRIILITGKVKFQINLDPSVWLFDERRLSLNKQIDNVEGTAIQLQPFLAHAEPESSAAKIVCHRYDREPISISIEEASNCFLCFAVNNKPIPKGGPVLLYLADGSNRDHPIDYITELEII